MSDRRVLRILTAFGPSRTDTLLLASHPSEEHAKGKPVPNRRTLVLRLQGTQAVFVDELPMALARSWYSTGSEVAYCAGVQTGTLHKYHQGSWSEEQFSATPVDFVRSMFGFAGATPAKDQLFLSTGNAVHIRTDGVWKRHALAGEKFSFQIHGRDSSDVYIGGSDKLFKWNGTALEELEFPDDDTVSALCVTSDDRLVGGNKYASVTTPSGGWQRIDTPIKDFTAFAEFQGIAYGATFENGIAAVWPGPSSVVCPAVPIARFADVGDALLALGKSACLEYDGVSWRPVLVPECDVGQRP
jgi:hypothetical protein